MPSCIASISTLNSFNLAFHVALGRKLSTIWHQVAWDKEKPSTIGRNTDSLCFLIPFLVPLFFTTLRIPFNWKGPNEVGFTCELFQGVFVVNPVSFWNIGTKLITEKANCYFFFKVDTLVVGRRRCCSSRETFAFSFLGSDLLPPSTTNVIFMGWPSTSLQWTLSVVVNRLRLETRTWLE